MDNKKTPVSSVFFYIIGIILLIVSLFMLWTAVSYTKAYLQSYDASFSDMWSNSVQYVIAQFVTSKTRIGRKLYAVGGSREAAVFSGINVKLIHFGTFVLGGILATFGGLILMSRLNSVAVTNGQNYEFDAVISSIIGGVSLAGGKGFVLGTMFGCIFLNTLFNGFSMLGVDPFVQDVLKGIVLVLAIVLDVVSNRKKS